MFSIEDVIDKLCEHRGQIAAGFAEFADYPRLLVALRLDEDMLLCREVKVEGASYYSRRGGDGTDISGGDAASRDLSQCGVEQSRTRFTSSHLPNALGRPFSHGRGVRQLHSRTVRQLADARQ